MEKVFFKSSFSIKRVFLSFRQTFVGRVVSTAFCLSIWPVCGEKKVRQTFFSIIAGHESQISLCSSFFQPSWRHCFLRVRRIILKTHICFEFFCMFFSWFWKIERKDNGVSVGKQIAVLSKLPTTCKGDLLKRFFFK